MSYLEDAKKSYEDYKNAGFEELANQSYELCVMESLLAIAELLEKTHKKNDNVYNYIYKCSNCKYKGYMMRSCTFGGWWKEFSYLPPNNCKDYEEIK